MTQKEIKDMAREIVGDGQSPNKWFVTIGPYYRVRQSDDESDFEILEGYSELDTESFGPFLSYEAALTCYDLQDLDYQTGIGQVFIEDRLCGTVTEKFIEKRMIVDYSYEENDDSKLFYKQ